MAMKKIFIFLSLVFLLSSCTTIQLPKNYDKDSNEVKTLSSKIVQARTDKGYTIDSFSALLVISSQYLRDIESGKVPPDIYLFEKISRYTGKSMEWFFRE